MRMNNAFTNQLRGQRGADTSYNLDYNQPVTMLLNISYQLLFMFDMSTHWVW